jgi:hypothetical protein
MAIVGRRCNSTDRRLFYWQSFPLRINYHPPYLVLLFSSIPLLYYFGFNHLLWPHFGIGRHAQYSSNSIQRGNGSSYIVAPTMKKIIYKLLEEITNQERSNHGLTYRKYGAFYNGLNSEIPLTVFEWATSVAASESARYDFISLLSQRNELHQYEAFYFETKGCSSNNYKHKSFEFVLVNAPRLASFVNAEGPNVRAFQSYFDSSSSESSAVAFYNLGGDARLVVPKPSNNKIDNLFDYSHLATFVRNIPDKQKVSELIQKVAEEYMNILSESGTKTIWLSTSGTGISWLHFRLDTIPKYYQFQKFAQET